MHRGFPKFRDISDTWMERKPGLEVEGAIHHVIKRGSIKNIGLTPLTFFSPATQSNTVSVGHLERLT